MTIEEMTDKIEELESEVQRLKYDVAAYRSNEHKQIEMVAESRCYDAARLAGASSEVLRALDIVDTGRTDNIKRLENELAAIRDIEAIRARFRAFFNDPEAHHTVEFDCDDDRWGEGRVLVDAVFNETDLLKALINGECKI